MNKKYLEDFPESKNKKYILESQFKKETKYTKRPNDYLDEIESEDYDDLEDNYDHKHFIKYGT